MHTRAPTREVEAPATSHVPPSVGISEPTTMKDDSGRLSIALWRSPRRSAARAAQAGGASSSSPLSAGSRGRSAVSTPMTPTSTEPRRTRGKRMRPSDSDSIVVADLDVEPSTPPASLRPHSSHRAIPSTKRKRNGKTPAGASSQGRTPGSDPKALRSNDFESTEIRIFPLRAILDDRVKRRIKRNGLSEEMNTIFDERRDRVKKTAKELEALRKQLAAKEAENERLREESSLLQETSRIQDLEREIADLKHGLSSSEPTMTEQQNLRYDDWDMGAADGFTDHGSIMDTDDQFGDDTTVEAESAHTPILSKLHIGSTLTPPNTSPTKPATPDFPHHLLPKSNSDAGVQAGLEDIHKTSMEAELTNLRCELVSLNKAFEDQAHLESQLRAKLSSAEGSRDDREGNPDLQLQMDIMVQTLADKTAALADLNKSLASLGLPGVDAGQTVSALKDAFHSVRQELEQLFPGEEPLPLSCRGVEVLDAVLHTLREAARKVTEQEKTLEEHRALESSLGHQLEDRASAMEEMGRKLREKDDRIFKLEDDVDRLQVAAEGYRGAIAELQALVQQMEAASKDFETSLTVEKESGKQMVAERDAQLAEMEAKLGSMISVTADLRCQLAEAHVGSEVEMAAVEASHDTEIALRDARLSEVQEEVTRLREALGQAQASVAQLRSEKVRLQGDADREKKAARDTVALLRTQLLQTLQMSEAFLAPPAPTHEPLLDTDVDVVPEPGF